MKTLTRVELNDFLIGCILGDGNLRRKNKNQNATYRESHHISQKQLLLWKKEIFEHNLDVSFKEREFLNNHGSPCIGIESRTHVWFTKMYEKFYEPKIIPRDMVERNFGILGLAVVYMDDGCTIWSKSGNTSCCELCLYDYPEEDVIWFKDFLYQKFGFFSKMSLLRGVYPKLRLYGQNGRDLLKGISPIVNQIECMRYKIDFKKYSESKSF